MSICTVRFCETNTPLMRMFLMSSKKMRYRVPPKAFRLDSRINYQVSDWESPGVPTNGRMARLSGPYWDDIPKMVTNPSTDQWSFRKTGTMWTLASQAEIDVWVQAPRAFAGAWALGVRMWQWWLLPCHLTFWADVVMLTLPVLI